MVFDNKSLCLPPDYIRARIKRECEFNRTVTEEHRLKLGCVVHNYGSEPAAASEPAAFEPAAFEPVAFEPAEEKCESKAVQDIAKRMGTCLKALDRANARGSPTKHIADKLANLQAAARKLDAEYAGLLDKVNLTIAKLDDLEFADNLLLNPIDLMANYRSAGTLSRNALKNSLRGFARRISLDDLYLAERRLFVIYCRLGLE